MGMLSGIAKEAVIKDCMSSVEKLVPDVDPEIYSDTYFAGYKKAIEDVMKILESEYAAAYW